MKSILSRRNLTFGGIGSLATLALLGKSDRAEAAAPEHPNVAVVQRYYEAYGASDIELIRNEIFTPDVSWTIPGRHPLARTKQGADEVFAFFEQLNKAQFKAEVLFLGGNDNYVVDVHRGWSNLTEVKTSTRPGLCYMKFRAIALKVRLTSLEISMQPMPFSSVFIISNLYQTD